MTLIRKNGKKQVAKDEVTLESIIQMVWEHSSKSSTNAIKEFLWELKTLWGTHALEEELDWILVLINKLEKRQKAQFLENESFKNSIQSLLQNDKILEKWINKVYWEAIRTIKKELKTRISSLSNELDQKTKDIYDRIYDTEDKITEAVESASKWLVKEWHKHKIRDVEGLANKIIKLDDRINKKAEKEHKHKEYVTQDDLQEAIQQGQRVVVGNPWGVKTSTQLKWAITGAIQTVADQDYTVLLKAPYDMTITETTTKAWLGTCTATFKINTTALWWTANSVSTTEQSQEHTSDNSVSAWDDIVITVSSNSSCTGMNFTILYKTALSNMLA